MENNYLWVVEIRLADVFHHSERFPYSTDIVKFVSLVNEYVVKSGASQTDWFINNNGGENQHCIRWAVLLQWVVVQ